MFYPLNRARQVVLAIKYVLLATGPADPNAVNIETPPDCNLRFLTLACDGATVMNRNVQALRALAVYAVVAHHVINALNHYFGYCNIQVEVGATGVDVFFVISGFIMAVTTSHRSITPSEFIKHRIVRIVPLYWLLTLISAGLMLVGFRVLFNNVSTWGSSSAHCCSSAIRTRSRSSSWAGR